MPDGKTYIPDRLMFKDKEVILLDIIPNELSDIEINKNLTLEDKVVKNRIVNDSLVKAIKSKPSPLYHKNFKTRIETGNLIDDIHFIVLILFFNICGNKNFA